MSRALPRAALGLAIALILAATAVARETPLPVGERAPDVELSDQHGKPFRLTDALAGNRFVVLAFYVKAFTGGWELEMSRFRDDAAKYRELGAEIVGISADAPDRNLAWSRELRLPFRLLSDRDGRLATAFGAWDDTWRLPKRVTFIVDRAGIVRYVESGGLAIDTSRSLDALRTLGRAP